MERHEDWSINRLQKCYKYLKHKKVLNTNQEEKHNIFSRKHFKIRQIHKKEGDF